MKGTIALNMIKNRSSIIGCPKKHPSKDVVRFFVDVRIYAVTFLLLLTSLCSNVCCVFTFVNALQGLHPQLLVHRHLMQKNQMYYFDKHNKPMKPLGLSKIQPGYSGLKMLVPSLSLSETEMTSSLSLAPARSLFLRSRIGDSSKYGTGRNVRNTRNRIFKSDGRIPFRSKDSSLQLFSMLPSQSTRGGDKLLSTTYEALMQKIPSDQFIDAVEKIGSSKNNNNGNKVAVIASDVAAVAGISLSEARKQLMTLATLTAGDIAVDTNGELLYTFPSNIKGVLSQNSFKYKVYDIAKKVWPGLFWLIRVTFGLTLVASLVAIFSAIFFIQTSSSSNSDSDRDDRRGGGGMFGGGGMGYYWGPTPLDYFIYRPYGSYGAGYYTGDKDPEEMGFLESVFSYVFGDGNPNPTIEERRLQLAATMIRQNKGSVTAEQLAPFCDENVPNIITSEAATIDGKDINIDSAYVDERYVLPIVLALNGEPAVTPEGDIVYLFPDLQVSAATDSIKTVSDVMLEKKRKEAKEAALLQRAGLSTTATSREIAMLLNYNGIRTAGAVDREDLLAILEDVLPPTSSRSRSSSSSSLDNSINDDPSVLLERKWEFTLAPGINKFLAGGLGIVNLGGALYLGNVLGQYLSMYASANISTLPPSLLTITKAYPWLLGYAVLFNVIPLLRNLWIQGENSKIERRNKIRLAWRDAVTRVNPGSSLERKIKAAKKMQRSIQKIVTGTQKDIIYDTRQSIESVRLDKEKKEMSDFDKKLFGNGNTASSGIEKDKKNNDNTKESKSIWQ